MIFNPYPYQAYCIDYLIHNQAVGLFLEPGLGKTVITLTALHDLRYNRWEVAKPLEGSEIFNHSPEEGC